MVIKQRQKKGRKERSKKEEKRSSNYRNGGGDKGREYYLENKETEKRDKQKEMRKCRLAIDKCNDTNLIINNYIQQLQYNQIYRSNNKHSNTHIIMHTNST